MVLTVLRTFPRTGIPAELTSNAHLLFLHSHGAERYVLKRVGNYLKGMEGMLVKDHHGSSYRTCCSYRVKLYSTADGIKEHRGDFFEIQITESNNKGRDIFLPKNKEQK